ncbi:MAG: efflux transporter outer membrane subunit [Azonexus sp.]|nr:efflux transporter outer membrane subunit [Azonexus sp.]
MHAKNAKFHGRPLAAAIFGLLLGGCAIVEPSSLPRLLLPAQWRESPAPAVAPAPLAADWWTAFGSAELDRLVGLALKDNPDLLIAAERIRQAEIALGISSAARLPNLGSSAGTSQSRRTPDGEPTTRSESSSLGLSLSYELDLWGRIAASVAAGEQTLKASRYDYETARLTLLGSVASGYFQALAAAQRLRIGEDNLAVAQRILAIVEARFANGVATPLEVSQQRTTVLAQQAALIPLAVQVRQLHSALALLLGQLPQEAAFADEDLAALQIPAIAPELPATLLLRRPDIATAEATLAANDANVAAARAALLPSASLSASGSLGSSVLADLANPTRSVTLALSLAQNIFDGGRLRLQTESARSQRAVQVINYGKAVRSALKEVDDGLGNAAKTARQEAAQQAVLDQAARTLALAELRYREGVGDLLTVLEAQRTVFSARDQLVTLRLSRLQAAIDLSKALGGGWQKAD